MKFSKGLQKYITYPVQGLLCLLIFLPLRFIPITWAVGIGRGLLSLIGPFLPAHRTMLDNLTQAFPEMPKDKIEKVAKGVWRNLGATLGETCQIDKMITRGPKSRVEIRNKELFMEAINHQGPVMFFGAHMGNWELNSLVPSHYGRPLVAVYRPIKNPYVDYLLRSIRQSFYKGLYPKGPTGAIQMMRAMKRGDAFGFLADQKLNEGEAVPFFGRDAMTATAPFKVALRYNCPVYPVRLERFAKEHFRFTVYPPLDVPKDIHSKKAALEMAKQANAHLESWIREKPEEWFWVHHRWPRSKK